jgi:hypothetical protein
MFKKKSKTDEKCEDVKDSRLCFDIEIRANDFYVNCPVYLYKGSSLAEINRRLAIELGNAGNCFIKSIEKSGTDRFLRQLEL